MVLVSSLLSLASIRDGTVLVLSIWRPAGLRGLGLKGPRPGGGARSVVNVPAAGGEGGGGVVRSAVNVPGLCCAGYVHRIYSV